MYILSFTYICALKTQKNGRLLCVPFLWYAISRTSRASHTQQYHQSGTLSATKAILWLARVTFFYQCVHTFYTFCSLHTFLPPADTKKRPHIKNVREAFSVICYIALILALGRLAFGAFSLVEKLAFGNVCGLISKPVHIEIVNV